MTNTYTTDTVNSQLPELSIKHADNQTGLMLKHLGV